MGQTVYCPAISKTFQGVTKKFFTQFYQGNLREQYCSNVILLYPDLNLLKMFANTMQTIFDKD